MRQQGWLKRRLAIVERQVRQHNTFWSPSAAKTESKTMVNDHIGIGVGIAIFCNLDNKFYLMQRSEKCAVHPGKWEFPGGKVELGETLIQAVRREAREECGVHVYPIRALPIGEVVNENEHWLSFTYVCHTFGQPRICELPKVDDSGWFTIDEIEQLDLCVYAQNNIAGLKAFLKECVSQ